MMMVPAKSDESEGANKQICKTKGNVTSTTHASTQYKTTSSSRLLSLLYIELRRSWWCVSMQPNASTQRNSDA
jgi:hypothetical protein